MGGDEFLLTVHGAHVFDVEAIRAQLDAVRRESVEYNGVQIGLDFSMGIVHVSGQEELTNLMRATDR